MKDFTKGNLLKHLLVFSLPIVLGDFLFCINTLIDAVWVGRLLGHKALASVSVTTPLIFFFFSLIIGIRVATNIMVSQSYGAKKIEILSRVLINSLITSAVLCFFITLISIVFSNNLLDIINTPSEIKRDAHTYFVIISCGLLFKFMLSWFSGILRGLGDSKTPMIILAGAVILNIILTPILILGVGLIPRLGIAGSALGSIFSTLIASIVGYVYLIQKNKFLNISKWRIRIDMPLIKKIFIIGAPVSMHLVIKSVSWIAIIALVNKFGVEMTAAYGIGLRLDMFAFLTSLSIGIAVSSMVAQNLGAGKKERIPEILKWSILLSLCFSSIFFILVNVYPQKLSSVFTANSVVLHHTEGYLRLASLAYLMFSFIFVFQGVLIGAGDTGYQLIFTVISIILVRLPLAYVLAERTTLKETGIWLALVISAMVAMLLNYAYYLSGKWQTKKILLSQIPAHN